MLAEEGHAHEAGASIWDGFMDLLMDPSHWMFEAATDIVFAVVVAFAGWIIARPWVKAKIIQEHDAEFHRSAHNGHETPNTITRIPIQGDPE